MLRQGIRVLGAAGEEVLAAANVDATLRPGNLTIKQMCTMAEVLYRIAPQTIHSRVGDIIADIDDNKNDD